MVPLTSRTCLLKKIIKAYSIQSKQKKNTGIKILHVGNDTLILYSMYLTQIEYVPPIVSLRYVKWWCFSRYHNKCWKAQLYSELGHIIAYHFRFFSHCWRFLVRFLVLILLWKPTTVYEGRRGNPKGSGVLGLNYPKIIRRWSLFLVPPDNYKAPRKKKKKKKKKLKLWTRSNKVKENKEYGSTRSTPEKKLWPSHPARLTVHLLLLYNGFFLAFQPENLQ